MTKTEAHTPGRNIYLASRYSRFPEMQKVREDLSALGYTVTSRWINGGHELTKEGSTEAHEAERVIYAQEDFADLLAADCVISFTEIPRETKTRGGRHVEHGMALALGKRTIVVGYRENVFHCLPQCEFFADWPCALAAIAKAETSL
jgi:nucleoside 2-deoxyribosyltransferase